MCRVIRSRRVDNFALLYNKTENSTIFTLTSPTVYGTELKLCTYKGNGRAKIRSRAQ